LLAEISTFLDDYPWFILWKWINRSNKNKKILQRYVIYISDQITVPYLKIETGNCRLNIGGWYVFARRKGLKIYFFSTNSLNYVKYFLTIWWNRHRRFQCKENMTINALIFLTTGAFNITVRYHYLLNLKTYLSA
jgi:hypothetical protein